MRARRIAAVAALGISAGGVGAGAGIAGTPPPPTRLALAAEPGASVESPKPALADELLPPGRYRLEIRLASKLELPRLGEVAGATASISEARVEHGVDGGVRQRHRVCALWDATAARWGGLLFPEAFVAALDGPRYGVMLDRTADGRVRYLADLGRERIGFAPRPGGAPGSAAALPTRPADPRVRDWDGDGQPGATVRLRLPLLPDAELWIVQRARAMLDGAVVAPGRVEGGVRVMEFDQEVIGARPAFLRRTPRQRPDPQASRFRLVRVEGAEEPSGCEDLLRHAPPGAGSAS